MRVTVVLDDDLLQAVREYTSFSSKTALLREALQALIEREAGRRLFLLAGTMPELENIQRMRKA